MKKIIFAFLLISCQQNQQKRCINIVCKEASPILVPTLGSDGILTIQQIPMEDCKCLNYESFDGGETK